MKNVPFYKRVICFKILGGEDQLWHAKLKMPDHLAEDTRLHKDTARQFRFIGAGNTADNAIWDLHKQLGKADLL